MRRRRGYSHIPSYVFLVIVLFFLVFVLESCERKTDEKADLFSIITMPNHPKYGDTKEYVESVWGEWMHPFNLILFTSYQPNVYLDKDDKVPAISMSFHYQQPYRLNEIHFSLKECGIDFSLDEAIRIAKSYIDKDFLEENYYLAESKHYTYANSAGEYYQSYVWKDSTRDDLPSASIVIRFYHDSSGIIHSLSFHYKGPRDWYQNDDRVFTEWDFDLWQSE